MTDLTEPKLPKWPFCLGDLLLLGAAYLICSRGSAPLGHWEAACAVLCVAAGTLVGVAPFVLEYRARVRMAEGRGLATVTSLVQNLEGIAGQIGGATGRWQEAQEHAEKTARAAKEMAERMTGEVKGFTEFMQRANDSEKATLRLEADKLRRGEVEWLQLVVRLLDHVYALNQGALHSGQPNVIEQVGIFQNACRDAVRRVGLTPFVAQESEPFDAQRHQALGDDAKPPADATVAETVATGYTFQGRMVRPALVRLNPSPAPGSAPAETPAAVAAPDGDQSQLPLERE
jgi:molecular chaperone GrpE (heat shock protein)